MAKDAFYFSHDSNARNDEKMLQLRAVYKSEGYGWYWIIIEMMRDANAYRLHYDSKYFFKAMAEELKCEETKATIFIQDCVNEFNLFSIEEGYLYSDSFLRRMAMVDEKREKASTSAKIRWDRNANAMRTHCDGNAKKKRKEKKSKEDKIINIPFESFWDLYDKKTGKVSSEKKWVALTDEERLKAMKHIPTYKLKTPEAQYRKNPEGYLHNKMFNDEISTPPSITSFPSNGKTLNKIFGYE
jgi:hypothetical protein